MLNWCLGDSLLAGATCMGVLMESEQHAQQKGQLGCDGGSSAQDSAQRAYWGTAAKSN